MCVERRVQSEFTFLGYIWQSILQRKIQNVIITLLLRLIFYAVVRYIKSNIGFRRKMYCLHWRVHDALNGYLFIIIFFVRMKIRLPVEFQNSLKVHITTDQASVALIVILLMFLLYLKFVPYVNSIQTM